MMFATPWAVAVSDVLLAFTVVVVCAVTVVLDCTWQDPPLHEARRPNSHPASASLVHRKATSMIPTTAKQKFFIDPFSKCEKDRNANPRFPFRTSEVFERASRPRLPWRSAIAS